MKESGEADMKKSRSSPHRPCLREHPFGGSEVWFTNQPERVDDYNTMEEDVSLAIGELKELLASEARKTFYRGEQGGMIR